MKHAFSSYIAVLGAALLAGNYYGYLLQQTPFITQETGAAMSPELRERLVQTAEQLDLVLNLGTVSEWSVFAMPTGQGAMAGPVAVDGLGADRQPVVRFLFDRETVGLICLSAERHGANTAACRQASEYRKVAVTGMARIGEVLGGVWRRSGESPVLGGVYHSRWRCGRQTATVSVDLATGGLIYFLASPDSRR